MKISIESKETGNEIFYPYWNNNSKITQETIHKIIKNDLKFLKSPYSGKRYFIDDKDINVINISNKEKITFENVRRYASKVYDLCKKEFIEKPNIFIYPEEWELDKKETINACIEGFLITGYKFRKFLPANENEFELKEVCIVVRNYSNQMEIKKIIDRNFIIAESIKLARDLTNGPPNVVSISYLEKISKEIAKKNKLKIKVFSKAELKKNNFNLLLAVGSGAKEEPRLIELNYSTNKKNPTVCLLGKGIVFDSGGLNLKPGESLFEMKCDMAGAATVLGLINAISKLKLNVNIHSIIPLAENAVDKDSYRPSDIYTAYNKKTVVIKNTDAEGRLILADALSYSDTKKPDLTIDFATLTGAAIIALGKKINAGFFRLKDEKIKNKIFDSSIKKGEPIWELPLFEEYSDMLKDDIAVLGNIGTPPREAGTIIAALFLNEFVTAPNWIHFDFAGPAFIDGDYYYNKKGATGVLIRTIIDFLENYQISQ